MSFLNRFLPEQPKDDQLTSIVRNLEHLLNSRRGYGSLLCDFGLVDYLSEPDSRSVALAVLREIRDDIENYEPRLRLIDLRTLGRDERLRLHILITGLPVVSPEPDEPDGLDGSDWRERRDGSERPAGSARSTRSAHSAHSALFARTAAPRSGPCYLLVLFHVPTGAVEIKVCDVR
jgi:hypothetical protein